jgi:hypothetical protein
VSQVHYGNTTWRCLCGKTKETEAFVLPLGWVEMDVRLGTDDIISKNQKRILCDSCGPRFLFGGHHAVKQLPGPTKQLSPGQPVVYTERKTHPDSIAAKKKSKSTGRFRK